MSLRFVVTGTGRSGTGYIAQLLRAAGLRCGHEDWFTWVPGVRDHQTIPRTSLRMRLRGPMSRLREEWRRRRQRLDGDASWMAVPSLMRFKGMVFLQLRHPLAVISSLVSHRFFSDPSRYGVWLRFAHAHFQGTGDDVLDAMRWWVQWNAWADPHADLTYHLEELDVPLLTDMLDMLGLEDPESRARHSLATVPVTVNSAQSRGVTVRRLSWDDLPSGAAKQRLREAAASYGYSLEQAVPRLDARHETA